MTADPRRTGLAPGLALPPEVPRPQPTTGDVKRAAAISHLESAQAELGKACDDLAAAASLPKPSHSVELGLAFADDARRQIVNALTALGH